MESIYLKLTMMFVKVGTLSFGGGAPMIAFFYNELEHNNWLGLVKDYPTIVAIAQLLPGPFGIDASVYIGYRIAGFIGVAITTIAVSAPVFIALLFIARNYQKFQHNVYIQLALKGLRPIVIALLFSAAWTIQPEVKHWVDVYQINTLKEIIAIIFGFILLSKTKITPVMHFSLFAIIGIIFF